MTFDEALGAILAVEAVWRDKHGHVTLADLGLGARRVVRSSGDPLLPPERFRRYPGAKNLHHEWV